MWLPIPALYPLIALVLLLAQTFKALSVGFTCTGPRAESHCMLLERRPLAEDITQNTAPLPLSMLGKDWRGEERECVRERPLLTDLRVGRRR